MQPQPEGSLAGLIDEVARARRYSRPLGLLFLDVDGFKQINDRFGHLTGDRVLGTIAQIIRFTDHKHKARFTAPRWPAATASPRPRRRSDERG